MVGIAAAAEEFDSSSGGQYTEKRDAKGEEFRPVDLSALPKFLASTLRHTSALLGRFSV